MRAHRIELLVGWVMATEGLKGRPRFVRPAQLPRRGGQGLRTPCSDSDRGSAALGEVLPVQTISKPAVADLIVGPEGGWSVGEIADAHDSDAILRSLGGRTVRADAVLIVALTVIKDLG